MAIVNTRAPQANMSAAVIPKAKCGPPSKFKPEQAHIREAQADAVISYARRVHDWPMLERAIKQKIEDQRQFVAWWRAKVTARQSPGRSGNKSSADRGTISVADAEKQTGISNQQVSKWRRRLQDPEAYQQMLYGKAWAAAMADTADTTATKWTGDPESYTPAIYIEAARRVMEEIDLDPASNALAQKTVKAIRWFGAEQNGLEQPWSGRVFLNPPYAFPEVAQFIDKLCLEFEAGNVSQAILLTNNNTDTGWWHKAAAVSSAVCFTRGRINFYKADGSETQPTNGQNFFYFGPDVAAFASVFSEFGLIMVKEATS
jgi:ParB family chromosome partitioning protein